MHLDSDILKEATEILKKEPSIQAAYIHGSTVKGNSRPDSDVDIAVLPVAGNELSLQSRLLIAGELETVFRRTVDVGLLSTQNLVYAKEVVLSGQLLFTSDPFISDRFIATCLAMYAELQVQRKEVLDAYHAA